MLSEGFEFYFKILLFLTKQYEFKVMMKKIYIVLFAILYFVVALTSTLHAVEFFGLSNTNWMAIMLACAFEIGQAAVLFALLTSSKDRSKIMPWVLMSIFTIVQVIGNVYASYKYITLHSLDLLVYFKEPIFVWTSLPDEQANVIITYICGGVLPLCALALTGMVTNYINDDETKEQQKEQLEEKIEEKIEKKEIEEKTTEEPYIGHPQVLPKLVPEIESQKEEKLPEMDLKYTEPVIEEKIPQEVEDVFGGPIVPEVNYPKQKSHFINI